MNFFLFLSFGLFLFRDFFPSYAFPSSQMCFMHFLFLEELFYLHFNFSLIFSVALFGLFPPLALCRTAGLFYIWKESLTKSAGILVSFPEQPFHVPRALTLPVVENYLGTASNPPTSSSFRCRT